MYGEDTDLSMRAWEAGYRPMITPEAEVVHTIGASSAGADRRIMIMRGKVTVATKHWPAPTARLLVGMFAAGVALRAGLDRVKRALRGGEPVDWAGTWARRSEWLGGYPPLPAAEAATLAELADRWRPNSRSYTAT